jgi:hypothetical protein
MSFTRLESSPLGRAEVENLPEYKHDAQASVYMSTTCLRCELVRFYLPLAIRNLTIA